MKLAHDRWTPEGHADRVPLTLDAPSEPTGATLSPSEPLDRIPTPPETAPGENASSAAAAATAHPRLSRTNPATAGRGRTQAAPCAQ